MKKILLAVTGSVAVVKVKKLQDILKKQYVIKTIVSEYIFENYSDVKTLNPIIVEKNLNSFPQHIELAKWADLILVVPASSNTLAKLNSGIADSPLLTTLLAARSKIFLFPAMNTYMYESLQKRNIISNLLNLDYALIGPVVGKLREGETGLGRMVEPTKIAKIIDNFFNKKSKTIAVSYGSSRIKIDKIRYLTNYSSGKLGKLIINELLLNGYNVLRLDISKLSNDQALEILKQNHWDAYISAGAFSDVKTQYQDIKLKKDNFSDIRLFPNIDVIKEIRDIFPKRKIIGFKHDNLKSRAIAKKNLLNLNFIVWNKIGSMNSDFISGEIIGNNYQFENLSKAELAKKIVEAC